MPICTWDASEKEQIILRSRGIASQEGPEMIGPCITSEFENFKELKENHYCSEGVEVRAEWYWKEWQPG